MADTGVTVRIPRKFSFNPNDWAGYRVSITRYFKFCKAAKDMPEKDKRKLLLLYMGKKADKIAQTFEHEMTERTTLEEMLIMFDNYFTPQINFYKIGGEFCEMMQQEGQSYMEYYTEVYKKAALCDLGDKRDRWVCVKILHGIRDRKLAIELRENESLTLEGLMKKLRSRETMQANLREERHNTKLDATSKKYDRKPYNSATSQRPTQGNNNGN